MADQTPLTDEERAELEQLRAEKAARAQAAADARDRAELNRLKEERARNAAEVEQMAHEAELRERGRKLMEPDEDDLKMPMGQKIVLLGIAAIVIFAVLALVL